MHSSVREQMLKESLQRKTKLLVAQFAFLMFVGKTKTNDKCYKYLKHIFQPGFNLQLSVE